MSLFDKMKRGERLPAMGGTGSRRYMNFYTATAGEGRVLVSDTQMNDGTPDYQGKVYPRLLPAESLFVVGPHDKGFDPARGGDFQMYACATKPGSTPGKVWHSPELLGTDKARFAGALSYKKDNVGPFGDKDPLPHATGELILPDGEVVPISVYDAAKDVVRENKAPRAAYAVVRIATPTNDTPQAATRPARQPLDTDPLKQGAPANDGKKVEATNDIPF